MQMKTTTTLLLACAGMAFCNTEIVKLPRFPASELPFNPSSNWPVISTLPKRNLGLFEIHPVALNNDNKNNNILPDDLWVVLEIDEWRKDTVSPDTFTLRLSWPASIPVDFDVSIFRPSASQVVSESMVNPTWSQYARIRAYSMGSPVPRDSAGPIIHEIAQFALILEPLLWGVIPRSIVPTLSFLFVVIGLSSSVVPRLLSRLGHVAEEARVEANKKRR